MSIQTPPTGGKWAITLRIARIAWRVAKEIVGFALALGALLGLPAKIMNIGAIMTWIGSDAGRWILFIVGMLILFWNHGAFDRLLIFLKDRYGDEPPPAGPAANEKQERTTTRRVSRTNAERDLIKAIERILKDAPPLSTSVRFAQWVSDTESYIESSALPSSDLEAFRRAVTKANETFGESRAVANVLEAIITRLKQRGLEAD
jgi:hypothetical protein